jgi:hypothetical protein
LDASVVLFLSFGHLLGIAWLPAPQSHPFLALANPGSCGLTIPKLAEHCDRAKVGRALANLYKSIFLYLLLLQLLYFAILQFISWDRHRKHVLAPASVVGSVSSEAFQTAFGIINEALQFPQGVLLILGKGSRFSKHLQHHVNRCFLQMRMKRLHPKMVPSSSTYCTS